ncbi:hypothetical protein LOAG_18289 [Loa loa]|uniref:Uncharacterized protein n=1 Tax=Loa loa TaxID=7209 RepID=A0A1S0UHN1_LOALO|nr:hypothetical protein LOAG_18289 [Loa loa]EJD74397.1 hypothetical protein LOAG_18289 [Loa loa]
MDQNPIFPSSTTTIEATELQMNPALTDGENIALTDNINLSHGIHSHIRSQNENEIIVDTNAKTTKISSTMASIRIFDHKTRMR